MARLPALVDALAKTDGRDAKALVWVARAAREAGLITTTKRGAGAAEMTARDAANLLLCANIHDAPREALALVPMVRAFVPRPGDAAGEWAEATVFGEIGRARDFGEALETAIDGALEILVRSARVHADRFPDTPAMQDAGTMLALGLAGFSVEFHRRAGPTRARMALWVGELVVQEWVFQGGPDLIESGYYARQADCDREVRATVGLKTLVHLCVALRLPDEEAVAAMAALEGAALEGVAE